jgi:hypothetical protein
LPAGEPAGVPVMWDFWPLAHLVLIVALWRRPRWGWGYAVTVAALESAVVLTKFVVYLRAPDLGFFRLLWFTNKVYVLALFLCLLYVLLGRQSARRWRGLA